MYLSWFLLLNLIYATVKKKNLENCKQTKTSVCVAVLRI